MNANIIRTFMTFIQVIKRYYYPQREYFKDIFPINGTVLYRPTIPPLWSVFHAILATVACYNT
jgi:hypothetical protein